MPQMGLSGQKQMADIFISYAAVNRKTAELVMRRLKAEGYSVVMDRHAATHRATARARTLREIEVATAVIGLWSRKALGDSHNVAWECQAALDAGKLIAVEVEKIDQIRNVPPELRCPASVELVGFTGSASHPGWRRLKLALQRASRERRLRTSRRGLQAQPAPASAPPAPAGAGTASGLSWRLPVAVLLIASAAYLAGAYYFDLWPFPVSEAALP